MVLGENTDALALVSMFYYANLILNIVFAFFNFKKSWVLIFGLICFLICDTFIGVSNMVAYINLENNPFLYTLLNPGFNAAWAFYVPSQTLLAISLLPEKTKKRVWNSYSLLFYIKSDPSSGITSLTAAIAHSIISSVGSRTVILCIQRPGAERIFVILLSLLPANLINS